MHDWSNILVTVDAWGANAASGVAVINSWPTVVPTRELVTEELFKSRMSLQALLLIPICVGDGSKATGVGDGSMGAAGAAGAAGVA